MIAIWKDINVNLQSSQDKEPYTIYVDGVAVYNGISYGIGGHSIRINDVVADYFTRQHPSLGSAEEKAVISVIVKNNAGTTVFSDTIIPDYSYSEIAYSKDMPYAPIDRRIDCRMPFVGTIYNAIGRNVYFDTSKQIITTEVGKSFALTIPQNVDVVTVGANEWQVVDGCDRYALYYINAFGGWDFLLCSGRHTESVSYTRNETKVKYDNSTPSAKGVDNWVNEESRTITLRTGFLTDRGAKNLPHLIGSPNVYLYDIESKTLQAVTISDTTANVNSYMANGAKPFQYTINVKIAQDFIRR